MVAIEEICTELRKSDGVSSGSAQELEDGRRAIVVMARIGGDLRPTIKQDPMMKSSSTLPILVMSF